jgi:branched-chain amino acid transport system permease protein
MAFFLENNPLSAFTGGENGLSGVPEPTLGFGEWAQRIHPGRPMYWLLAAFFFASFLLARRIVHSPFGVVLRAIKENTARAAMLGHAVPRYKLAVFVIAAAFAGLAGGLLGVLQSFMPPDAFMLDTSGQLVAQTVIGGVGTLIGPAVGAAVWLWLRDNLQLIPGVGPLWKLILGLVFVVLVTALRRGICGEIQFRWLRRRHVVTPATAAIAPSAIEAPLAAPLIREREDAPALETHDLARHYGGLRAVDGVSFAVRSNSTRSLRPRVKFDCTAVASPASAQHELRSSASARATSSITCSWNSVPERTCGSPLSPAGEGRFVSICCGAPIRSPRSSGRSKRCWRLWN